MATTCGFTIADLGPLEQLLEEVSLCEAAAREANTVETPAEVQLDLLIFTNDVLRSDVPARGW